MVESNHYCYFSLFAPHTRPTATRTHYCTAGDRVPCAVGPLNSAFARHAILLYVIRNNSNTAHKYSFFLTKDQVCSILIL